VDREIVRFDGMGDRRLDLGHNPPQVNYILESTIDARGYKSDGIKKGTEGKA